MKMTDTERAAGMRADFHVYDRRKGKLYFDAMWADTPDEAIEKMRGFAREVWPRTPIEIVRCVAVRPDA